jgi:hypothetical protein
MADEPIITPTPPADSSRAEERIKELSEKVRLTSEERDEKARLLDTTTRERDFYASFTDVVATNPAAKDHKDAILEKVKGGYTPEDATFAVLGKAGLLGGTQPQPQTQMSPAGGSATTTVQPGEKPMAEMSQAERRAALAKDLLFT